VLVFCWTWDWDWGFAGEGVLRKVGFIPVSVTFLQSASLLGLFGLGILVEYVIVRLVFFFRKLLEEL
jgi:hypothetical protein